MQNAITGSLVFRIVVSLIAVLSVGAVSFDRHDAGAKKTGQYATSGFFSGGTKEVTSARLKDVRRGPQAGGVERIVFDLEGESGAGAVPFFQLNINPEENRLLLSVWADVTYEHDQGRIERAFSKSAHIKSVNVMPRVEEGVATIELVLNSKVRSHVKVEAFVLSHPARIILDLL